jgi:deoxyadenosine/deoxycytidine kinase
MSKSLTYLFIAGLLCTTTAPAQDNIITFNTPAKPTAVTPGKVIFVTGSCSAGKSSMARILAQKLNAKSYAFDEYVMPIVLKKFVEKHYGRFLAFFINGWVARNFFRVVTLLSDKTKYKMQVKFYNDLKGGMAIEPTSKMYREVKQLALQGHNVVVESPLFLWDGVDCLQSLPELEGTNLTYVLAYCPWSDLVDRIKQRNASPAKRNHRELDWVMINYMHTLEIATDCNREPFLERLRGEDVYNVINKYSQRRYKKQSMCLAKETQQLAHQKFPTQDTDYYIYPRFTYNVTINTQRHSPEQGANVVLDYMMQKEIFQ